uniref:Cytochrome P450 n=1 Tax=Biomphalaria glabrata TaxID=6526 RepID=A0A2C9KFT0_BIOGL
MDFTTLALISFTSLLVYAYYRFVKKSLNVPPCPVRPLPVVGHLLTLKADQRPQFQQWRKECGDIFSIYLGSKLLVVINDFDLIKETFVKRADDFSDRPVMFIDEVSFQFDFKSQALEVSQPLATHPYWERTLTQVMHSTYCLMLNNKTGQSQSIKLGPIIIHQHFS